MSDGVVPPVRVHEVAQLDGLVGSALGPSDWVDVPQAQVDAFAASVDDVHWAHNDPGRAAAGPFGGTIAHAHWTLSLVVSLLGRVLLFDGGERMFYGHNRVRFPTAVPVGGRVRPRAQVVAVEHVGGSAQVTFDLVVEVEGRERPACVSQSLWRFYPPLG